MSTKEVRPKRQGGRRKKKDEDRQHRRPFSISYPAVQIAENNALYDYPDMSALVNDGILIVDKLFKAGKLDKWRS